jgi:autotransporter-associated beta strand protein
MIVKRTFVLTALFALIFGVQPLHSVDYFWSNPAQGNWFVPENWTPLGPPTGGGGNHAFINNGGTALLDADIVGQIQDAIVGRGAGTSGTLNQTGGNHTNSGWVFVGQDGGTGTYNMSGTATLSTGRIYAGLNNATGTFTMSGTASATTNGGDGYVLVGTGAAGNGTFTMSGGSTLNSERIYVGGERGVVGGTGTMTIGTTGTITSRSDLSVGTRGGTGQLVINSGTVNANSWMIVGETFNGVAGTGTVTQNGGDLRVGAVDNNGRLWIASRENANVNDPQASGTYTIHGGTLTTPEIQVGRHYTGTFNQTGGTVNVNDRESGLGAQAGSTGIYNMSGGTLNTTANFQIGRNGTGVFNQTGGIVNANNWPVVGRFAGSNGTLSISGGVFNQIGGANRLIVGEEGTGVVNVSGDGLINSVAGLSLGHGVGGSGTVNLDSGVIQAPFIENGNATAPAKFNFNGGILRASQFEGDYFRSPNFANTEIEIKTGGAKFDTNGFDVTINQALSGLGGFTKMGDGVLLLPNANTFAGDTTVKGGTLRLGAAGSLASPRIVVGLSGTLDVAFVPAFTLASGQTLAGEGSVIGDIFLGAGAQLSPGEDAGTLTLSSGLNLEAAIAGANTDALLFELGAVGLGTSDLVFLSAGVLNIGSGALGFEDFAFTTLAGFGPGSYTLFDASNPIDGALGGNLTGTINGLEATIIAADNGRDIVLNVVPEPSTTLLVFGGIAMLARRRRSGATPR